MVSNNERNNKGNVNVDGGFFGYDDITESLGYTKAYHIIMTSPKLTDGEKVLYQIIRRYADMGRDAGIPAYVGNETLAYEMNCSERTVKRHKKGLIDKGLIRVERRGLNKTNYTFVCKFTPELIASLEPRIKGLDPDHPSNHAEGTKMTPPEGTKMTPPEGTKMTPNKEREVLKKRRIKKETTKQREALEQRQALKHHPKGEVSSISIHSMIQEWVNTYEQCDGRYITEHDINENMLENVCLYGVPQSEWIRVQKYVEGAIWKSDGLVTPDDIYELVSRFVDTYGLDTESREPDHDKHPGQLREA